MNDLPKDYMVLDIKIYSPNRKRISAIKTLFDLIVVIDYTNKVPCVVWRDRFFSVLEKA